MDQIHESSELPDAGFDVEDAFGEHDIEFWVLDGTRLVPATPAQVADLREREALRGLDSWRQRERTARGTPVVARVARWCVTVVRKSLVRPRVASASPARRLSESEHQRDGERPPRGMGVERDRVERDREEWHRLRGRR